MGGCWRAGAKDTAPGAVLKKTYFPGDWPSALPLPSSSALPSPPPDVPKNAPAGPGQYSTLPLSPRDRSSGRAQRSARARFPEDPTFGRRQYTTWSSTWHSALMRAALAQESPETRTTWPPVWASGPAAEHMALRQGCALVSALLPAPCSPARRTWISQKLETFGMFSFGTLFGPQGQSSGSGERPRSLFRLWAVFATGDAAL